jgi:hypothetical protein
MVSRRWLHWLFSSTPLRLGTVDELEVGVATEADVRARFGEPAAVYDEANGDRTLEYPRQPAGQTNYMISVGPDGRMTSLRQVLQPATFELVKPGLDKDRSVACLVGRPGPRRSS